MSDLTIRTADHDRADWELLVLTRPSDAEMRAGLVWLHDPLTEVEGLVCEDAEGRVIGLTYFRYFARPLVAATGCFLDDLFVALAARCRCADRRGEKDRPETRMEPCSITAEDNYRGRGDRLTNWVTYDIKL